MNYRTYLLAFLGLLLWSCNDDPVQPELFGNIHGIVQEADGTPIEGAQVSTNPATLSVTTDSLGEFAIDSILVRTYSITAQRDGFRDRTQSVELTEEATINVVLTMTVQTENNAPPTIPVLLEPANNATGLDRNPTLRWTATDPEGDDLTFTVSVFNSVDDFTYTQTTTDTFLQIPNLLLETTYLWTVSADDGNNQIVTSLAHRFSTKTFPDYRIHLVKEDSITGNLVIFAAEEPNLDQNGNPQDSLELIPLTDPNLDSWRPHMNPQRTQIAYISKFGAENHLWIMDRNGGNRRRISVFRPIAGGHNVYDLNFAWEPNGQQILYPSKNRLILVDVNTLAIEEYAQADTGFEFVEVDWIETGGTGPAFYFVAARQEGDSRYDNEVIFYNPFAQRVDPPVLADRNTIGQVSGPIFVPGDNALVYSEDLVSNTFPDQVPRNAVLRRTTIVNPDTNISNMPVGDKVADTNDLYPAYSPGTFRLLLTNTPNDTNYPIGDIFLIDLTGNNNQERVLAYPNATMPDWQ